MLSTDVAIVGAGITGITMMTDAGFISGTAAFAQISAPRSVPMCSATSKDFWRSASPIAPHPNIHGTRIRCPELEIGANSVAPCTRPRTIACRMLTRSFRRERSA